MFAKYTPAPHNAQVHTENSRKACPKHIRNICRKFLKHFKTEDWTIPAKVKCFILVRTHVLSYKTRIQKPRLDVSSLEL